MQELCSKALGREIRAQVQMLDDGLHVLLTGGCRTHVGAVSLCMPQEEPRTLLLPGHRDDVLSARWARELSRRLNCPVCVACGIHYDAATTEQLVEILAVCEEMMGALAS